MPEQDVIVMVTIQKEEGRSNDLEEYGSGSPTPREVAERNASRTSTKHRPV
ncbi:MAG: hypothetical protein V1778_04635 [bacterium]